MGAGGGAGELECMPGESVGCTCLDGTIGSTICGPSGVSPGACECSGAGTSTSTGMGTGSGTGTDPTEACGDGTCASNEDCQSCADDCGICEPCTEASACTGNYDAPPDDAIAAPDLNIPKLVELGRDQIQARLHAALSSGDVGTRLLVAALDSTPRELEHPLVGALRAQLEVHPEAREIVLAQLGEVGLSSPEAYRDQFPAPRFHEWLQSTPVHTPSDAQASCGALMLRVAMTKITVHEEDDDFLNDIVYCALQAAGPSGSEVKVSPKTPNLDEGDSHTFPVAETTFWGQRGPTAAEGDLTITYDCIESDTANGHQELIDAIAEAAAQYVDTEALGEDGWVSETAGTVAQLVSFALALDSDDPIFNASHTIAADRQLELTNGAVWTVRREGTHLGSDWDWELFVSAWGCAENGAQ